MYSHSNAVLVAVAQVGIVVIGVLATALSHKFWANSGLSIPLSTTFLVEYGVSLLLIPLAWISMAIGVQQSRSASSDAKDLAFWSGTALIVGLVVFELYAIFRPWITLCTLMGDSSFDTE